MRVLHNVLTTDTATRVEHNEIARDQESRETGLLAVQQS